MSVPYRQQVGGGWMKNLFKRLGKVSRSAARGVRSAARKGGRVVKKTTRKGGKAVKRVAGSKAVRSARGAAKKAAGAALANPLLYAKGAKMFGPMGKFGKYGKYRMYGKALKGAANAAELGYNGYQMYNMFSGRPYQSDGLKGALMAEAARAAGIDLIDDQLAGDKGSPAAAKASRAPTPTQKLSLGIKIATLHDTGENEGRDRVAAIATGNGSKATSTPSSPKSNYVRLISAHSTRQSLGVRAEGEGEEEREGSQE